MKHIHYLYIGALAFLIACNSEERITTDSNEEPSGPIKLSAGIVESSTKATTRSGAEDNHANHQALTSDTKLALRVSGTWTGHGNGTVIQTTTATVGATTGTGNLHNSLTCSPLLYWDDYGSADPANATTGRTEGLTIYGAAINGKTTAPAVSDWNALSWEVPTNQTTTGNYPADKDLLISNNVKADTGDGTYKFDERASGKLLEFTHALSKITVNLNANNGFTGGVFASDPEVRLTSNVATSTSNTEWAYTTGSINITTGTVSSQATPAVITMWQAASAPAGYDITKEALVMPGSQFTSDGAIIARINADGNIYYVTAAEIRAKIAGDSKVTEAGKNYIINVTVNKTDIVVTATVADWTNISADNVEPVINLIGELGGSASNWGKNRAFSFYRSTSLSSGYSNDPALQENGFYREESVLSFNYSSQTWSMDPVLYWPNHNTHYQFRAVWPRTVITADDENYTYPHVESGVNSVAGLQIIKVKNVAYTQGTFPSDLMIARPNVENQNKNCGNNETGHTKKNLFTEGICAREGNINLTFNYMMSQVEVNLSTKESSSDPDYVNLTNAKVEIVNVYNYGDVKLGDRLVNCGNYSKDSYTLDVGASDNNRLSAIVPQTLTYTSALHTDNVMFRITIYNNGDINDIDDIYYADIEPIYKQGTSTKVAPNGKWESGVHYVYNLRLTKTNVQVTASLTDWTTVEATHNIWF